MLCCSRALYPSIVGTSWLFIIEVPLYCYGSNYCNVKPPNHPTYMYSHSNDVKYGSTAYPSLPFQHIYTHLSTMSHVSMRYLRSQTILMIKQGTEPAFSVLANLLILWLISSITYVRDKQEFDKGHTPPLPLSESTWLFPDARLLFSPLLQSSLFRTLKPMVPCTLEDRSRCTMGLLQPGQFSSSMGPV